MADKGGNMHLVIGLVECIINFLRIRSRTLSIMDVEQEQFSFSFHYYKRPVHVGILLLQ